jgi:hypothetical protein
MRAVVLRRITGTLLLPILVPCLFGCLEGPRGRDGADVYREGRDSLILDLRSAWEFNYLHHPFYAGVFGLSEDERAAYRLADTTLLRRDSLPNDLFAAAKYAPREWTAYYEYTNQISCDRDSAIPSHWIARFADAASDSLSYFCVDRGLPFTPVRGSALLQFFDGKGFDIGSFFAWERIPEGKLRIYYR